LQDRLDDGGWRRANSLPDSANILPGVFEGERGEPSSEGIRPINVRSVHATVGSPTALPSSEVTEAQASPSDPADGPAGPRSPLLKAIVDPDIYTVPADRALARSRFKANRLKLSPIDQHDLQDLMDIGLIEMRNDAPVLTNAGFDAIV
jgi:hypothetical protein